MHYTIGIIAGVLLFLAGKYWLIGILVLLLLFNSGLDGAMKRIYAAGKLNGLDDDIAASIIPDKLARRSMLVSAAIWLMFGWSIYSYSVA